MNGNRRIAAILVIAVIFVIICAATLSVHGADHVCVGDNCRVCAYLNMLSEIYKLFAIAISYAAVTALDFAIGARAFRDLGAASVRLTPTMLKVKLLD